jgi:hypothetical protein
MAVSFDEERWRKVITQQDWYAVLYPELKRFRSAWEDDPESETTRSSKHEVRKFFEAALQDGTLALAKEGPDLDTERKPIDTIVIHHTSSKPGYRLSYMNAVQLLNIYVPYFNKPGESIPGEERLQGRPLWSNHVRGGRPVFYAYHWLMRMDGNFERLLEDNELGWHAANWDINCRSVAICLDNDYERADPTTDVLQKLAVFIAEHYPQVGSERIFGHGEVSRHPTICPGTNFVDGWKSELLGLIRAGR